MNNKQKVDALESFKRALEVDVGNAVILKGIEMAKGDESVVMAGYAHDVYTGPNGPPKSFQQGASVQPTSVAKMIVPARE